VGDLVDRGGYRVVKVRRSRDVGRDPKTRRMCARHDERQQSRVEAFLPVVRGIATTIVELLEKSR